VSKNQFVRFSPWCQLAAWPLLLLLASALSGCSLNSERKAVALPTGHYEGSVTFQGTELQAVLELREAAPGQLEADLRFPEEEGLSFPAENLSYTEPELRFDQGKQPGGISVSAVREGDFLRGVFQLDSIKADFVWVRRGKAQPRPYQTRPLKLPTGQSAPALTLFVPQDTSTTRYPAVALFAEPATQPAAQLRADQLARQGFVTTVVALPPASSSTDSAALRIAVAVVEALRQDAAVDTLRVGLWARGASAAVVPAATLVKPKADFVVLESVSITAAADAKPFQALNRQRVRFLGLYAAADTSLNAKESARRLRTAVGLRRGTQVRIFPKANAQFIVPGTLNAEGKWTWPKSAPGYLIAVDEWLK